MFGVGIFDLYRRLLGIVLGVYTLVNFVNFVLKWQADMRRAGRSEAVFRRYLVTALLRVRLRKFWLDFVQIGLLVAVLVCVLWLHPR
jgi:hypothetical protein